MDYFYVLVFVILAVIILLMTDQLRKADKQLVALKTKLGDTEAMLSSARYTREKDQKSLSAHQEHIERLETEIRKLNGYLKAMKVPSKKKVTK